MKRIVGQIPEDDTQSQRHSSSTSSAPPPASPSPSPSVEEKTPMERTPTPRGQARPSELMDILVPSLRFGAAAGACGVFTGAAAGIIRSAPTVFFAAIAGGQWFTLGTSYYATRLVGLKYFVQGEPTSGDKLKASTVAGGVAGSLGGLLRGPRNIIPGALVFSFLGAGGQVIANWRASMLAKAKPKSSNGFWSRWSPLKQLSDKDYVDILEEKLIRVEADIALIDDRIREFRESESQTTKEEGIEAERSSPASSSKA